jgi:hypothetical protein
MSVETLTQNWSMFISGGTFCTNNEIGKDCPYVKPYFWR